MDLHLSSCQKHDSKWASLAGCVNDHVFVSKFNKLKVDSVSVLCLRLVTASHKCTKNPSECRFKPSVHKRVHTS